MGTIVVDGTPDDEILAALRRALAEAEPALQRMTSQREMIQHHEEELLAEVVGLRLAVDRRERTIATQAERRAAMDNAQVHGEARIQRRTMQNTMPEQERSEIEAMRWRKLPRTDAIIRVLSESDEPMSPSEIAAKLRASGRNDRAGDVSGTLPSMRRRHGVKAVGRAQYVLPKAAPILDEEAATQ